MPPLLRGEKRIAARRHSRVVWMRKTSRFTALAMLAVTLGMLTLTTWWWTAIVLSSWITILVMWRARMWEAEWLILTDKRIIRVQGVAETTSAEASLRLDRVSGARLVQTVPGKLFGYGDIELEAPGNHPDVKRLMKVADVLPFYLLLRGRV